MQKKFEDSAVICDVYKRHLYHIRRLRTTAAVATVSLLVRLLRHSTLSKQSDDMASIKTPMNINFNSSWPGDFILKSMKRI